VSLCFTIRHGKRLGDTLILPRLESLGSFKVSASVSEAATSSLVLVSETWVSGLVSVSAQKVSCTSLFKRRLLKRWLKQTVNQDIAVQKCWWLMLFSFDLMTECCLHYLHWTVWKMATAWRKMLEPKRFFRRRMMFR